MARPYSVFISHSSKDAKVARLISGQIEIARVGYFLDEVHLRAGDKFRQVIRQTIPKCQELLLLLSASSLTSQWLPYELGAAEQGGLHISPILLDVTAEDVARHPGWLGLVSDRTMLPFERFPLYLQQLRERAGILQDSRVIRPAPSIVRSVGAPPPRELEREIEIALQRLGLRAP